MWRFPLIALSVLTMGPVSVVPSLATSTLEAYSAYWLEPVARDYRQRWKKKTAKPETSAGNALARGRSSDDPESGEGASRKINITKPKWARGGSSSMGWTRQAKIRAGKFPSRRDTLSMEDMAATQFWLEMPDNRVLPVKLQRKGNTYQLNFRTKTGGNYRLLGYNGHGVEGGDRLHHYAFYSFMTHGDKPRKKTRDTRQIPGFHNGRPMLELFRLYDREGERYRSRAGHRARVRVLFKGEPLTNAPLILTTSKNWSKSLRTDAKGEAEFVLVKDDFQEGVLDKRKSSLYMLQTEHVEHSPGQLGGVGFDNQRYIATLSFSVFPDSNEWESKHFAFLIAMVTMIGAGTAIAIRRKPGRNTP